jgi:hypothetical protein
VHAAHKPLSNDGAHRAAEKLELERSRDEWDRPHGALDDHESVSLPRLLSRFLQPIGVAFAVFEFQAVHRLHFGADLEAPLPVKEEIEPLPRREPIVMPAFRADVDVVLEIGAIQHGFAGRALAPKAFGHRLACRSALGSFDLGRKQLL